MSPDRRPVDTLLAWYFVIVWGSGFLATKAGLQYAAPFTFLSLRFILGIALMVPIALALRARFPRTPRELVHVVVAGILMHTVNLGGSHYAQYLGMSAGITALILSVQPLLTAMIVSRWMHERLAARQWLGIGLGLAGVALVVWHKVDIRAISAASLAAVTISLAAITAGTLYQRAFCREADLRAAPLVQFVACLAVTAPLAWAAEGARIDWTWQLVASVVFLVVLASILATNALHVLMRHGQATKVTSLMYLTPIIAVALEYLLFGVAPTPFSMAGIAVTTLGVALVFWRRRPRRSASDIVRG